MAKKITVTNILDNLNTTTLSAENAYSNAAKAYERKQWLKESVKENRLTDFLETLEQAINALSEGTETIKTLSATTGKEGTKKVNRRDIAKRSYSTAFAGMVADLGENGKFYGKVLAWKLSRPEVKDKVVKEKTIADKLATILGETIDNKGLSTIVATIETEQARHKAEVEAMAATLQADKVRTSYLEDIARVIAKGRTEEQALTVAAAMNDITVEELKVAIA